VSVSADPYNRVGQAPDALARVRLPTEREEDLARRFTVNRHYLHHLRIWLEDEYGHGDSLYPGLAAKVATWPAFGRIKRRPADLDAIEQILRIAWMSEIQLHLPGTLGSPQLLRYSNAWAPVHAYYAAYMALQGWLAANGLSTDNHTAALATIANQIGQRHLFPPPWSVLCVGSPLSGERSYLNEPPGADCGAHVEVLSIPISLGGNAHVDFWPRLGTWLRTTREARLKVPEQDWKEKEGRKRMDSKVRRRLADKLAPTSIFDCFWRMRIRSNYQSVEPYLVPTISDQDVRLFYGGLVVTTRATLALLELYLARAIGVPQFVTLAESFLRDDAHGISGDTLGARLTALTGVPGGFKLKRDVPRDRRDTS